MKRVDCAPLADAIDSPILCSSRIGFHGNSRLMTMRQV